MDMQTVRLVDLNPSDWEQCQLAVAVHYQRVGALCPNGHPWLRWGRFLSDHRVRCGKCMSDRTTAWRRKQAALRRLAKGGW